MFIQFQSKLKMVLEKCPGKAEYKQIQKQSESWITSIKKNIIAGQVGFLTGMFVCALHVYYTTGHAAFGGSAITNVPPPTMMPRSMMIPRSTKIPRSIPTLRPRLLT